MDMPNTAMMPDVEAIGLDEALLDYDPAEHAEQLAIRFPTGPVHFSPVAHQVLLQDRSAKRKTKGGLIIPETQQSIDERVEFIGKVIAVGPLVFWHELSGEPMPGAPWFRPGNFVLLPKTSSTRYRLSTDDDAPMYRLIHFMDILATVQTVQKVLE